MGYPGAKEMNMWLYINELYSGLLKRNGLEGFTDFMMFRGGKILKQLPSRMIIKIEIPSGDGKKTFFLKRHTGRLHITEILRTISSGFSLSWGRKEWEVIQAFHKCGIPTITPVAAGEKISGLKQESFLMTEELQGFQSLEIFLKSSMVSPFSMERIIEKRGLIQELAEIARKMHQAGFNHRDFYCCHIFIRHREDGKREWKILDLQRVDRRRWFRRRWIIKDLAALNYSAPSSIITQADRLRFLKNYLDSSGGAKKEHKLIRSIIRKTYTIMRHDHKLQQKKALA